MSTMAKELSSNILIREIQKTYPNYHPILAIVKLAHSIEISDNYDLQYNCHKTVARYVAPELKSVEMNVRTTEARRVKVSLFDEVEVIDAEMIEDQLEGDYAMVGVLIDDRV